MLTSVVSGVAVEMVDTGEKEEMKKGAYLGQNLAPPEKSTYHDS